MAGVRIEGLGRCMARLGRAAAALRDLRPLANEIGIYVCQAVVPRTFREQRDPVTGEPWKPLATATIARRRSGKYGRFGNLGRKDRAALASVSPAKRAKLRAGIVRSRWEGAGRILFDTGALLRSVTYRVEGNSILVGSRLVYAGRHNYGYPGGQGRGHNPTPRRRFLGLTPDAKRTIREMISRGISGNSTASAPIE